MSNKFLDVFHKALNDDFVVWQGLKARGNVEEWLGKVEEAMFVNLRKIVKFAISDFERKELEEWVTQHPSQV